jgi:hypothetical protein
MRYSAGMQVDAQSGGLLAPRSLAATLGAGGRALLLAAGARIRAELVLAEAGRNGSTAVVLSEWSELYRSVYESRGGAAGRICILPAAAEAAEFSLRLTEYEAGLYRVLVLDPDQLWLSQCAAAFGVVPPGLFIVDAASLAAGINDSSLRALEIRRRLTSEFGTPSVLMTCDPLSVARIALLNAQGGAPVFREGPVVPERTVLRFTRIRLDRERLEHIRRLLRPSGRRVVIVAPTRGTVNGIAASLQSLGIDCVQYHAGLSVSERDSIVTAYRGGRLRAIVATEALAAESSMVCPDWLIFSHPPSSPEALARFAGWAESAHRQFRLTVLYTPADLTALPSHSRSRIPTIAQVRETYRHLLALARNGFAMVSGDGLHKSSRGTNRLRVEQFKTSLFVLEVAGYIVRSDDLPRAASVTMLDATAPFAARIQVTVGATIGVPSTFEPLALAAELKLSPQELQRDLLQADRSGSLTYRGHGRDRLYVIKGARSAAPEEISRLVRSLEARATKDAAAIVQLLTGTGCRRRDFEGTLGWPASAPCGYCDRCKREPRPEISAPRADIVVALMAVAALPFTMRRGALHRVVAAAMKEVGRPYDKQRIATLVEEMLARGLLAALPGNLGEVFGISDVGRSTLAVWEGADGAGGAAESPRNESGARLTPSTFHGTS